MIKLNDKEYKNCEVDVRWGTFVACSQGQKRTGLSPFLTFCVNGEIFIGLELSFSKEMFENLENGVETSIDRYVTCYQYTMGNIDVQRKESPKMSLSSV